MFQMNLIRFVKMFSYVFLYKSLQGLAQVNRTWLSLIVGYASNSLLRSNTLGVTIQTKQIRVKVETIPSYLNDYMPNQKQSSLSITISKIC